MEAQGGRFAWVAIGLLLASAAGAMADAGRTGDAPDRWEDAWTVEPGTYQGHADHEDDWYRVELGAQQALAVTFERSGGDSWDEVEVREDDGVFTAEVDPGQTVTVGASTDALRLGVQPFFSSFDYTLTLERVDVEPQDDAGSGMDAGNHWRHATPTDALGEIDGARVPTSMVDPADWYEVPVPEDHWVRARSSDGGALLYDADGEPIAGTWGPPQGMPSSDHVFAGVEEWQAEGGYTLTVEAIPVPDAAVTDLSVRLEEVGTDAGSIPTGTQRTIEVEVANHGEGPTVDGMLEVWVRHPQRAGENPRELHEAPITLDGQATRTIEVPWDTTGEVGDATVHAEITSRYDLDWSNDHDTAESYVLVGDTGAGVDLLNQAVEIDAYVAHTKVRVHWDHGFQGVNTDHAVAGNRWGGYAGLSEGEPTARTCNTLTCVSS